jgi:hypothetical protein
MIDGHRKRQSSGTREGVHGSIKSIDGIDVKFVEESAFLISHSQLCRPA